MLQNSGKGRGTLRALNIEARRQRILAATGQIIEREGIDALSMRKIARDAGVSVTTLYNLFGSRNDILYALVHEGVDRIDRILESEAPLDDPIERCRAVITVSIAYLVERAPMYRPILLTHYKALPDLPRRLGMRRRAAGMQRVAIEAAIARRRLRDVLAPDVLASQIYHGYEMAAWLWAEGLIDAREFEARALYGLYVALLGVASDALRPELEAELKRLEAILGERMHPGEAGEEGGTACRP